MAICVVAASYDQPEVVCWTQLRCRISHQADGLKLQHAYRTSRMSKPLLKWCLC